MGAHWFGALAGSAESRITARDGGVVTWTTPPVHLLRAQLSSPTLAASMKEMSMHSSHSVEEAATARTMQTHRQGVPLSGRPNLLVTRPVETPVKKKNNANCSSSNRC